MNKRVLVDIGKYVLGIGLLAWLIWRNWETPQGSSTPGLRDALQMPIHYGAASVAGVLYLFGVMFTFVRWYFLVRAQGLPFTVFNAFRLGLVGFYFSNFLPGGIGGDLVKATAIARGQSRRTVAVATVLLDRAIGLLGIIFIVAILGSIFWLAGNPAITGDLFLQRVVMTTGAISLGSIVGWIILGFLPERRAEKFAGRLTKIPKVGHSAAEFWRAVWMYRNRGGTVLLALCLSLCCQVCFVSSFALCALVFQDPQQAPDLPTLTQHFLIVPLGIAIQALFPTPGGLGGGEYGFGKLYTLVGKSEMAGFLASLAYRIIIWTLSFLGYLVYVQLRHEAPIPQEEPAVA